MFLIIPRSCLEDSLLMLRLFLRRHRSNLLRQRRLLRLRLFLHRHRSNLLRQNLRSYRQSLHPNRL